MIYLDSAATSFIKPGSVRRAVLGAMKTMTSPGRGGHPLTVRAEETAFKCREAAAKLFGVGNPENVVFTSNATHSLNIAIKSLISKGDRVIVSGYEHNAVIRPLAAVGARIDVASSPLFEPEMAVMAFENKLFTKAAAVICNHVSNVFGCILPIEQIAGLCRKTGLPLIVDASQSAGIVNLDMGGLGAAFVAMPGHKGLFGPQGTGLLLCANSVRPLIEGGTGSVSLSRSMPSFLPDRLEAGTHNMPGIAGLLAGIEYVSEKTPERILTHEQSLVRLAAESMRGLRGVRSFVSLTGEDQSGVLSFEIPGMPCEIVAERLAEKGVALRSGLHCSPLAHETAGTLESGTVRMSVCSFTTRRDVHYFLSALEDVLRGR